MESSFGLGKTVGADENGQGVRFVDLFSGIGGFRLAGESLGGTCVFSSEIDPKARLVYHENYGEWPSGDIRAVRDEDVPDHDVLVGGFPCQAFSISGKQKGFEDARGTLFFEIARIVRAKRPSVLFLENVRNLVKHDEGKTFSVILRTLEECGYNVYWKVLNAAQFGSPTARQRIYIVAFRSDLCFSGFQFPEPTNEPARVADVALPDTATDRWVLNKKHSFTIDENAVAKARGINSFKPQRVGQIGHRKPAQQGYRMYSEDAPAITFCAHGGGMGAKSGYYLINGRVRRLDPRECLRAMGFPDSFIIPPSVRPDQVRTLTGNTIVVPLVRRIFQGILEALKRSPTRPDGGTVIPARTLQPSKGGAYNVVSLFSGCGAMDLGFKQAGFHIGVASEICLPASHTHEANFIGTTMVRGDITDPCVKDRIFQACGGRCDVLIAGPPCGPFSRAGKRNPNDPRARLFLEELEMVERLKPFIVVTENVQPILSAKNPSGGLVYDEIVEGFRRLGYVVAHRVTLAADYGVPQLRKRIFIVASRLGGSPIRFPEPTHTGGSPSGGKLPWVTMADAIGDLVDAPEDKESGHVFPRHNAEVTERYKNVPIGGRGCVNYNEGAFRNPPGDPSVTIKTGAWPLHYKHPRTLTCREAARVQSFPDSFRFMRSRTATATVIGNAVPPLLARAMAMSVKTMLDEARGSASCVAVEPEEVEKVQPVMAANGTPSENTGEGVASTGLDEPTSDGPVDVDDPPRQVPEDGSGIPRLLSNAISKKGKRVLAWSIGMLGDKCPFASSICERYCYARRGRFRWGDKAYARRYEASKRDDFVDRICAELRAAAWKNSGGTVACSVHEKGDFYSLGYLAKWTEIIRRMASFPNLSFFIYTRAWISEPFRRELERIGEGHNVLVNQSTDREMLAKHGMPQRIGRGLVTFLAETDDDLPAEPVDLVFRNLCNRPTSPMERLGGCLVCPHESNLFVAKDGGETVLQDGKPIRIRCQECRLCIDRSLDQWERIKSRYAGKPGLVVREAETA